jgi:hypothetical protein
VQALIELLAGFIALLVTAALSQFGVDIQRPEAPRPEVHRISDCGKTDQTRFAAVQPNEDC